MRGGGFSTARRAARWTTASMIRFIPSPRPPSALLHCGVDFYTIAKAFGLCQRISLCLWLMNLSASSPQESTAARSSEEVLKRIQQETQRVRRRLTNDSGDDSIENGNRRHKKEEQYLEEQGVNASIEISRSGVPIETTPESYDNSTIPYIVEGSESHTFEDPVPARNMSSHLKSEHEAFKQR